MVRLRRYFARSDGDHDEVDGDEYPEPARIGPGPSCEDLEVDDESIAALKYLESVKSESKSLPFAVEALIPEVIGSGIAPRVDFGPFQCSDGDDETVEVVIEYFQSLRELINRNRIVSESKSIKFVTGMSDSELACADYASISSAIEFLADSLESLPQEAVLEYIWGLLVYLEFPLLEDTSASLQRFRRYCDDITDHKNRMHYLALACSVVISQFFHQPA